MIRSDVSCSVSGMLSVLLCAFIEIKVANMLVRITICFISAVKIVELLKTIVCNG